MGYKVVFTDEALKDLDKLDKKTITIIIKKIRWFSEQDNLLKFAKVLKYDAIGQYRFRIGSYRVIFDINKIKIIILKIGHGATVYK